MCSKLLTGYGMKKAGGERGGGGGEGDLKMAQCSPLGQCQVGKPAGPALKDQKVHVQPVLQKRWQESTKVVVRGGVEDVLSQKGGTV
jgi:hypothetical protein